MRKILSYFEKRLHLSDLCEELQQSLQSLFCRRRFRSPRSPRPPPPPSIKQLRRFTTLNSVPTHPLLILLIASSRQSHCFVFLQRKHTNTHIHIRTHVDTQPNCSPVLQMDATTLSGALPAPASEQLAWHSSLWVCVCMRVCVCVDVCDGVCGVSVPAETVAK